MRSVTQFFQRWEHINIFMIFLSDRVILQLLRGSKYSNDKALPIIITWPDIMFGNFIIFCWVENKTDKITRACFMCFYHFQCNFFLDNILRPLIVASKTWCFLSSWLLGVIKPAYRSQVEAKGVYYRELKWNLTSCWLDKSCCIYPIRYDVNYYEDGV